MALEEDKTTGSWKERSVCMGDQMTCSFPGLINHHHKFIISFAEDEAGALLGLLAVWTSTTVTNSLLFQGSCILWPLRTQVPRHLLGQYLSSWTLPGAVSDICLYISLQLTCRFLFNWLVARGGFRWTPHITCKFLVVFAISFLIFFFSYFGSPVLLCAGYIQSQESDFSPV